MVVLAVASAPLQRTRCVAVAPRGLKVWVRGRVLVQVQVGADVGRRQSPAWRVAEAAGGLLLLLLRRHCHRRCCQ